MASMNPESPKTKTREIFDEVAGGSTEVTEALKAAAEGAFKKAQQFVEKNPVAAIAVGFGIGVLIGAWLKRD
jgi:ElaB/YqjD/DUF883 family membrane-anchored ribosome-binding protein